MKGRFHLEKLSTIFDEIDTELVRSNVHQEQFNSLHECHAVIAEELDELWDVVRMKRKDRSAEHIRKELVQLAAMAVKGILSLDRFTGGTV
jgi:hypothetical protein